MSTEHNPEPNCSESSHPLEDKTTSEPKIVEPTQQSETEATQPDVEFVNPNTLISRQMQSEMTGSKIKKLMKKISKQGFDSENPIEVADINDRLIILDGHHRVVAAKRLKLESIPIRRKKVSPAQEQELLQQVAEAAI
ncbi:MAG TPA: ParB N-terminal domain-containing protein, partial [Kamptonema sp.]|nr:ParB N-terminal domain-containing protein [Kamptonema sp.]